MGVHLTFVRSIDLDEWTQRQMDAMRLGGNGNAREFFRTHGFTEMYGSKSEKKYKSKAAVAYKAELKKLIDAEAVKRGEMVESTPNVAAAATNLLENLELSEQEAEQELAKRKLSEARTSAGTLKPTAALASSMPGASKLSVPSAGMLRKPASSVGSNFMKKKATTTSKLRVNKLTMKIPSNGNDDFEDIEATQKAAKEAERESQQLAYDEKMAKKKQIELEAAPSVPVPVINGTTGPAPVPTPAPTPVVAPPPKPAPPKKPTYKDNVNKLQDMNKDFFSQF